MSNTRRAITLAGIALVAACHKGPAEDVATTAPVPVQVAEAHLGTITEYLRVTGTVDPAPGADWTALPPDRALVAEVRYATGDMVRRGSVVVRFDAPPLRSDLATRAGELASARARLENARKNYDRLALLLEKGIASRKEMEDARKELLDSEAAVRQSGQTHAAAADLAARATAVAPFDGVVSQRWHNPGEIIDASEHVLRLVDPRRLQVTAAVPVADAPRVVVGRAARVTVPGNATVELPGKVVGAPAFVDPTTGTAAVRIAVAGPLPVGTSVEVAIVADQRSNALIVPAAAIVREEDKTFVFVVDSDNKAHRRAVVAGLSSGEEAQIVSGVREGEKVVVKGYEELPDGAVVTIEETGAEAETAPAAGSAPPGASGTGTGVSASAAPGASGAGSGSTRPPTGTTASPQPQPPGSSGSRPAAKPSPGTP
jgi:cobalt-zinc-cadmium efflux system membrane fusion protein